MPYVVIGRGARFGDLPAASVTDIASGVTQNARRPVPDEVPSNAGSVSNDVEDLP